MRETTKHREAFDLYWSLGADRSIERLHAALKPRARAPSLRSLYEWSRLFHWQVRVARLEGEARRAADEARIEDLRQMLDRHAREGLLLQQKGAEWITGMDEDHVTAETAIRAITGRGERGNVIAFMPTQNMGVADGVSLFAFGFLLGLELHAWHEQGLRRNGRLIAGSFGTELIRYPHAEVVAHLCGQILPLVADSFRDVMAASPTEMYQRASRILEEGGLQLSELGINLRAASNYDILLTRAKAAEGRPFREQVASLTQVQRESDGVVFEAESVKEILGSVREGTERRLFDAMTQELIHPTGLYGRAPSRRRHRYSLQRAALTERLVPRTSNTLKSERTVRAVRARQPTRRCGRPPERSTSLPSTTCQDMRSRT